MLSSVSSPARIRRFQSSARISAFSSGRSTRVPSTSCRPTGGPDGDLGAPRPATSWTTRDRERADPVPDLERLVRTKARRVDRVDAFREFDDDLSPPPPRCRGSTAALRSSPPPGRRRSSRLPAGRLQQIFQRRPWEARQRPRLVPAAKLHGGRDVVAVHPALALPGARPTSWRCRRSSNTTGPPAARPARRASNG